MKSIRKNYNLLVYTVLLAFFSVGCENALKEENPSQVTTDFLYTTPSGLQAAVNGLYTIERNQLNESETNTFALIMGDGGTDLDFNRASDATLTQYRLDIDLTTNASVRSWWQKWYRIIERSNSIISFGEVAQMDDKTRKAILREAYVYRAYAYFWLVRKYENIWLNLEPTTSENVDGRTFPVAKPADVYTQIIADLDKAIAYYGTDWTVVQGRFNQGVARLLRADVAMWQQDYQTAATMTSSIIDSGVFSLVAPETVFTTDRRMATKEAMYVMNFDEFAPGGGTYHRLSLIFTAQYRSVPGVICAREFGGYGWARIFPNPYMTSLYDTKNDKRYNAYWQNYYSYNDPLYDFSKTKYKLGDTLKLGDNSSLKGDNYYKYANISSKKYFDWVKDPLTTKCYENVYMFRYPLVLLLAAEANMRLGDNTKALQYINKIRDSRYVTTAPNRLLTTINENIYLDEFAREMAFEGQRWFLLKRLGKLVERVKQYGGVTVFRGEPSPNPLYSAQRANIQPYHVRWPIPQAERDAMGGFPQNDGYNK